MSSHAPELALAQPPAAGEITIATARCPAAREKSATRDPRHEASRHDTNAPHTASRFKADVANIGDDFGRYIVLRRIGAGGMGVVYEAIDPDLDRKVAIKLLHANTDTDSLIGTQITRAAQARLVHEAQSLAQLSHPNIVSIYDVGYARDQVYLAMELIEGVSLDAWLGAAARPWRKILDVFVQAADGLAAAHAAHLVHRDFKPDNVLVGNDARPRILDFGLAHQANSESEAGKFSMSGTRHGSGHAAFGRSTTGEGAIVGTPSYMAPEQHRGAETDERCDQYAFCVSLYEAVYGLRPFRGDSLADVARAKQTMELRSPPRPVRVPRWLRQLILTGLAVDPDDRHASMSHIAVEIRRRLSPRRRNVALASAATLACLGSLSLQLLAAAPQPGACDGASSRGADIWSKDVQARVRQAFVATGSHSATSSFDRVFEAMGARMRAWHDARLVACEATLIDGTQSEALLDLRMECLETKLADSQVVVDSWLHADARVVDNAGNAMTRLSAIDECEDAQAWQDNAALPADPAKRARALELESELFAAQLALMSARFGEAKTMVQAGLVDAERIDFRKYQAEAHMVLARMAADQFTPEIAREHSARAMSLAESLDDQVLASQIAIDLIWIRGYQLRDADGLDEIIAHARAHVLRSADDPSIRASFARAMGAVFLQQGRLRESEMAFREVVEIQEAEFASDDQELLINYGNLALVLRQLGELDSAEQLFRKVIAGERVAFGNDHPRRVLTLGNLARLLQQKGAATEALAVLDEALKVANNAGCDAALQLFHLHSARAGLLEELGRDREALATWQLCFELHRAASQHDDAQLLISGHAIIKLLARLGEFAAAELLVARLEPVIEAALASPPASADGVTGLEALMDFETARGNVPAARQLGDRIKNIDDPRFAVWFAADPPGEGEFVRLHSKTGNCQAALELIDAAAKRPFPLNAFAHQHADRAAVLARCGRHDEAADAYEQIVHDVRQEPAAASHLIPRLTAHAALERLAGRRTTDRASVKAKLARAVQLLDPRELAPEDHRRFLEALDQS